MNDDFLSTILFQPDPVCDFDTHRMIAGRKLYPEELLMIEIVGDAVGIVQRKRAAPGMGRRRKYENIKQAIRWIKSPGDDYIFSFASICERFGIDPEAARKAILGKRAA